MEKLTPVPKITVGELRQHLEIFEDDIEVSFSGLTFNRLKLRGPKLLQIEFGQNVYRGDTGEVLVDNVDLKDLHRA